MSEHKPVSRRDFLRVAGRYGLTSTAIAAAGMAGPFTVESLGRAAAQSADQRAGAARVTLKFGAAGFNEKNLQVQRSGQLWFVQDLEKRTNGALKVEFIGNNQICNQLDCIKKAQQGIIDLYTSSTQNAAGSAPYFNVLDYAYMFPSRAAQHHFFYHPKSETLLREPMRKHHNIQFLYTHCELRGLMLGSKYKDKPPVTSISQLAGTKNRVTGTQLGRIAMQLMQLNPVPIAWEETLDGLKQGLIDGAETWMAAVAYAGMTPVLSQAIDLKFFCGTEHTAMNWDSFKKLPATLQDAVMESSYAAQQYTQKENEDALVNVVGATDPPKPGTLFAQHGVRFVTFSPAELRKAEQMCSPEFQPKAWDEWRERLNKLAGGIDTYKEIYTVAREIPANMAAVDVKPRKWWQKA